MGGYKRELQFYFTYLSHSVLYLSSAPRSKPREEAWRKRLPDTKSSQNKRMMVVCAIMQSFVVPVHVPPSGHVAPCLVVSLTTPVHTISIVGVFASWSLVHLFSLRSRYRPVSLVISVLDHPSMAYIRSNSPFMLFKSFFRKSYHRIRYEGCWCEWWARQASWATLPRR